MPSLDDHQALSTVKMMFLGNSGSGKTGALAPLTTKYDLFIQDYDNGLDILLDPKILDPSRRKRIHYVTLTDKLKPAFVGFSEKTKEPASHKLVADGPPTAFKRGIELLTKWEDYGPVSSWGPDRILVIDSLTMQGQAAMRYTLDINSMSGLRATEPIWGDAIDRQEGLLQFLFSESVKCHVIVISHVVRVDTTPEAKEYNMEKFPAALGNKLPQRVGRYFNSVAMAVVRGEGSSAKHVIRTRSEAAVALKVSAPSKVPAELPLETGLLDLFTSLTQR